MSISGPVGPSALPMTFPRVEVDAPGATPPSAPRVEPNAPTSNAPSFADALGDLVQEVDGSIKDAEHRAGEFAEGRSNDIHGTMISMQEADVRLRLLGNVRNRALEAYREIMRMGA